MGWRSMTIYKFILAPLALVLLGGCAAGPDGLRSAEVFAGCPAAPAKAPAGLPAPVCAEQESIYGGAVWAPVFGPLYEAAANGDPRRDAGLTVLATLLPGIGPALMTGLGAQRCLTECLPAAEPDGGGESQARAYLELALDVSDRNCRRFLERLPGALPADATAGDDLAFARLAVGMADAIQENRRQARKILQQAKPARFGLQSRVAAYDGLCSAEHALATMAEATRNQLSGSQAGNAAEQKAWLAKSGVEDGGGRTAAEQDAPKDAQNHINRVQRGTGR
jgi:hypothetical protein